MKIFLVFLVTLVLILTSCAPRITAGTVVEKNHEEEYRWLQLVPIKIGKATSFIYLWHTDDEDWTLTIRNGEVTAHVYVDQELWDTTSIGDFVDVGPKPQIEDDIKKEKAR